MELTPIAVHADYSAAIQALEETLARGLDPESTPVRAAHVLIGGQLLIMPAFDARYAVVKLVTVARPGASVRVGGLLVLFDARTLTPLATIDSAALTALRTPALSALAVARLAPAEARTLILFGTGVQAWAHLAAFREVRNIGEVRVIARDAERLSQFLDRCHQLPGLDARVGRPSDVADADIIACCTTAREPLFHGALPKPHATIVAIGSHEATAREVDEVTVRRSTVVVDGRAAVAREAGDLIINGALDRVRGNIADLVAERVEVVPDQPRLFKSVGMAWQDLAVAVQVYEAAAGRRE